MAVPHTRVKNSFFDAALQADFGHCDFRVLMTAYRIARGWGGVECQQKPFALSAGIISKISGVSRESAKAALRRMRAAGVLVQVQPGRGPRPALFTVEEDPERWASGYSATRYSATRYLATHQWVAGYPVEGSGLPGSGYSATHKEAENHDDDGNPGTPKTEKTVRQEDNHSARAREGVGATQRPATDRATSSAATGYEMSPKLAPSLDADGKPQEPAAPEAEGAIPADLRERVVVIQGEIPDDPTFCDWESLDPHLIVEVDGRREELDWMAAGLTLECVLFPAEPEPELEPERPKAPPIGERVWTALRDDEALHTQWKKRQRVEQVVSWAMQSPENAAQVERVLDAISANVDSPTAFLLSFFTVAGARNSRPLRGRGRRMAAPYTHRR